MPNFFEFLGFWIGRFSDEKVRPHVHVLKFGSAEAMKVWLEPEVEIESVKGINPATANRIIAEIRRRRNECLEKWHAVNGGNR